MSGERSQSRRGPEGQSRRRWRDRSRRLAGWWVVRRRGTFSSFPNPSHSFLSTVHIYSEPKVQEYTRISPVQGGPHSISLR